LMYVFFAGAALALASVSVLGAAVAGVCLAAAATLLIGYDDLPRWTLPVLVAIGTGLCLVALSEGGTSYAVLLAIPAAYSAYFLRKAEAALVILAAAGGSIAAGGAVVTAFGLLVVAGLVGLQRANVNRLIWRLSDVAVTDELTGLLNRRGFHDLFETELERARRSGRPLSVIVGDLDAFKAVNDRFGHAAGDRALERLSEILQAVKRRIDTAARIGGEEFAVIAPDTDHHAAYILAERMRREVRDAFAPEPFPLTISLGIATFPRHGATGESLIGGADEALYAAKKLGRDRTVVYNPELADSLLAATGQPAPRAERHSTTVLALAEVIDIRDEGTAEHSETVGRYAGAIARELGLGADLVERVRFGGIVHDVGKIGIPDSVLRKPGWLSDEDWREMHRHPEIGARILRGANLDDIGEWVLAHHERPDGEGYPHGLSGNDIPLEARILAVADAYEAMTSDRVYRPALTSQSARAELLRCSGTQFDGRVVDAFLTVLDREDVVREVPVAG
ncbi:MAG: hypothetical protein QOE06_2223, partial [Thermoleophilaceae bacterium]|nr:hypothetical protein [Thermoleophilaceae bacterium]